MNTIKSLAAIAIATLTLASCDKEETVTGIVSTKAGVTSFECVTTHASKTIELSWDATEAVAAGAKSFSVQLIESTEEGKQNADMYDGTVSTTVAAVEGRTSYTGTINGASAGLKYYVRIRANYERSQYSDWTYLTTSDGKAALFKLGRGIIREGLEDPYIYKVIGIAKGFIVKWDSISDAQSYVIEHRPAGSSEWTAYEAAQGEDKYRAQELLADTDYEIRALAVYESGKSEYCDIVTVTTKQPGSYPRQMGTADDLATWLEVGIAEVADGDTYELTADIDLTGYEFASMEEGMAGIFEGNGHKVTGLTGNMFHSIEGTVRNLTIEGSISSSASDVASLAITNHGSIENVTSTMPITYTLATEGIVRLGGLVCENSGTISGSAYGGEITFSAAADISEAVYLGGIAAYSTGSISDCTNSGSITFTADNSIRGIAVAGVAGYMDGGIKGCYNKGAVSVTALYANGKCLVGGNEKATPAVAGIVAYGGADGFSMEDCHNLGSISYSLSAIDKYAATYERTQVAGVVANPNGDVTGCSNEASIIVSAKSSTGEAYSSYGHIVCVGGIGGGDYFATDQAATNYTDCTNSGKVAVHTDASKSNSAIGGICGWPGKEGSRKNSTTGCTNSGAVSLSGTGKGRAGGIHGGSGIITSCVNTGSVTLNSSNDACAIGGLAGFSSNGFQMTDSRNEGTITSNISCVGGVAGMIGNLGNSKNAGLGAGNTVSCTVINGASDDGLTYTGMLVGKFNGTSAKTVLGTKASPVKVSGSITIGGDSAALTEANFETYLVGTANASSSHSIFAEFGAAE